VSRPLKFKLRHYGFRHGFVSLCWWKTTAGQGGKPRRFVLVLCAVIDTVACCRWQVAAGRFQRPAAAHEREL
jgi:hypothetical protein